MGEIKSVKVDNWGVFFLQKLQNFFNKTDYCDLTLQFRDNSQLKVHRLVLSACTDYFNVLEQTCELVDDALIMPNELQADVVVPIVNFMYTGTLEFELKMYGKLLRTAKEMNMTVLLKLLEAHRRTMEGVNRAQRPPSPKAIRRRNIVPGQSPQQQPPLPQQRRILTSPNTAPPQRRFVQTKTIATNASSSTSTSPQQPVQYRQQIGSTSLLKTSGSGGLAVGTGQIRAQYGNITVYETTQQQQQHHVVKQEPEEPFEQLRKGYNNNKRPLTSTIISPPAKKPNIEDVKEFAEQQRMRKQIAAEYGDDVGEYESSMLDDDIHLDDDDDDATGAAAPLASSSTVATAAVQATSTKSVSSQGTTITINQSDKPPTIVVKDSTNSKMNHAKIIKEVLRQYPELVKTNKNIRLKIMPNPHDQAKIIIKKEPVESEVGVGGGGGGGGGGAQQQPQQSLILRTQQPAQTHAQAKPSEKTLTQQQQQTQKLSPPTPKQMPAPKLATAVAPQTNTVASSAAPAGQKRRIDSKTMHALIALGAENTTGPWLCLRCGVNGRPISIPSYRGFRRHLINTHKETIDAALCEHCGWRSSNNRELHYHMEVEHKVKTPLYTFPECLMCAEVFVDTSALNQHMVDAHPDENKQQCIYCNKIFAREMQLYTHMKTFHKQQAIEDGIIDYSDEEFPDSQDEQDLASSEQQHQQSESKDKKESKVKILSDISLPIAGSLLKLEPSSEANALSTVASGIAASINISNAPVEFMDTSETGDVGVPGSEPKFVNVDGNEMVLTAEQRKEIMSQLNQEHGAGGVVMVLNEPGAYPAEAVVTQPTATVVTTVSEQKDTEVETEVAETTEEETGNVTGEGSATEEDFDDSQIYNEFNTQNSGGATATATVVTDEGAGCERAEKKNASGTLDESKESMENLEWAENLISAQEAAEQKAKNDDVINQKLKELTGDWTDDENDDEELPAAAANVIPPKPTTTGKEDVKPTSQAGEPAVTEDKEQEKVAAEGHEEDESQPAKSSPDEMKDESTVEDAVETDDSKTEATGESTANLDDSKTDEDDIDILMKSLHKDDTSDALKAEEKSEKQQEEPEVEADADEDDAKSERSAKSVDKEVGKAADFGDAVKVDIKSEKVSPGKKEKTVKKDESGVSAEDNATDPKTAEPKEENVDAAPSMKSEKASPLVAAVERDALLAELIGQPDSLLDEQEFLSEPEQKSANAADTVAVSPAPVDLEEAVKEEAQPEKSGVEPMETDADEDVEAAVTETTATAAAADEDAAEKTTPIDSAVAAVTPTPSKTADTVKSLISEWADDDDDAEQL